MKKIPKRVHVIYGKTTNYDHDYSFVFGKKRKRPQDCKKEKNECTKNND